MSIKRILVTQPQPTQTLSESPYARIAASTGAEIVYEEFSRVEGTSLNEFRTQRVAFEKFPMVIFTNRTAVDHFFRLTEESRYVLPIDLRYFCISEAVSLYLQKYTVYRKRKIFISPDGTLEGLLPLMEKYKAERFLLPTSKTGKPDTFRTLKKAGFRVTKGIMFHTVSRPLHHLDMQSFDMLIFYSPFGVQALFDSFPDFKQGDTIIAAFGKNTQMAVRKMNLKLSISAPSPRFKSITEAVEQYILANQKE